jgi:hypothetical protein
VSTPALYSFWRHKKTGGLYQVTTIARLQTRLEPANGLQDMDELVVYRSIKDSSVWVRSLEEFVDGRFEQMGWDWSNGQYGRVT